MKKFLSIVIVAAMCAALLVGCGSDDTTKPADTTNTEVKNETNTSTNTTTVEEKKEHAEYTVYNSTGAKVTELYLYDAGSTNKGENLAGAGLEDGATLVITRDLVEAEAKAAVYVLEFKAENMTSSQKFETLHFEVAPINLLSVDAAAGATPIQFKVPMEHAEYTVYNSTGATVTELYLYNAGSTDKGENLAGKGIAAGDSIVITRDLVKAEAQAAVYVLEFKAENMTSSQKFETLHFEVAPINLLSVDAAAGATPIKFKKP